MSHKKNAKERKITEVNIRVLEATIAIHTLLMSAKNKVTTCGAFWVD